MTLQATSKARAKRRLGWGISDAMQGSATALAATEEPTKSSLLAPAKAT